jgi:hypothetical protein
LRCTLHLHLMLRRAASVQAVWLGNRGLTHLSVRLINVAGLRYCDLPHVTAAELQDAGVAEADRCGDRRYRVSPKRTVPRAVLGL